MSDSTAFDVIVIGAGMGGLVAACQLGKAGKQVLLVENLSFIGGRFSGFKDNGSEIPSGAFHTFPHGEEGPFAQALRRSGVDIKISNMEVFASFHVNGEHIIARNPVDLLKVFPSYAEKYSVVMGLFQSWSKKDYPGSFGDWLIDIGMSDLVQLMYDRCCQFMLSTSVFDIPYSDGRKVIEMIFKYGGPGVPMGGAREVAKQLGLAAKRAGVVIRKNTRVQDLLVDGDRVSGVTLLDRRTGQSYTVNAPLVISNIGPENTLKMASDSGFGYSRFEALSTPPPATGFKLQVLSPKSLIDHDTIMFCLDTKRVAGILQASNVDPNLAPAGKHLLISHQATLPEADWLEERELALEDWRYLFGKDFEECEVLGSSHFPERFPVNWARQGYDLHEQIFADHGLWMVGDGMKPTGLMMAEGVGAIAESVARQILGEENITPWEVSQLSVWTKGFINWIKSSVTSKQ